MSSTSEKENSPLQDPEKVAVYDPRDHEKVFNPRDYLKLFYVSPHEDSAMKTVLFFLPGMAQRIPESKTLLDVGSGPTVHVALDYAIQNRTELTKWWKNEPECFDWSSIIYWLSLIEGETKNGQTMAEETRSKIKDIFKVDVLQTEVIQNETDVIFSSQPELFDVITSVFCLEYATETKEEYRTAVANVLGLLKPDGYILLGGVMRETSYFFGQTRFRCFFLTKEELLANLKEGGIDTESKSFKFVVWDDVFVLVGQKKLTD